MDATDEDDGSNDIAVTPFRAERLEVAVSVAEESVPADDDIEDVGTRNVGVSSTTALKLEVVSASSRSALVIEEEVYIINLLHRSPECAVGHNYR